jgi:phosphatidylserine/phosphatidylglycerophosphate/cardiolipin synthase-like enzyme
MDDVRAVMLTNALLNLTAAIDRLSNGLADRGEEAAQPAFRIDEIREKYPQAYVRWSPEDDATLREAYENGQDVKSLADAFGRNEGAIRARLTRLMFPVQDG